MMKINSRIFCFPPYISTSWNNVIALHMKVDRLIVSLVDGDIIEIPGLPADLINMIFAAHATFLEFDMMRGDSPHQQAITNKQIEESEGFPIRFGFTTMDNMGSLLQHNPDQANAPDIPPDVVQKIAAISKIVGPHDPESMAKPEPHCNCMFCQIARAVTGATEETPQSQRAIVDEPHVSDDELKFSEWIIEQIGDQLYAVTNKLDDTQKYNVYLGNPVGCTCGKADCEHILAVLKS